LIIVLFLLCVGVGVEYFNILNLRFIDLRQDVRCEEDCNVESTYNVSVSASIYYTKDPYGKQLYSGSSATSAIQTAINAARYGDMVSIQGGVYPLMATLVGKSGVSITGVGSPILDCSQLGSSTALRFSGSFNYPRTVTSATKGSTSIAVSDTLNLMIGDMIQIASSAVWRNNQYSMKQGELHLITAISGNTVTLDSPLDDTYSTSSPTVQKATQIKDVTITGIQFIATPRQMMTALEVHVGCDIVVQGCYFENTYVTAILFSNCINSHALNNTFVNCNSPDEGYGVMFAMASAYCSAEDNVGYVCRHMITIGGYNGEAGIPRHISYLRNKSYDGVINGAFDTHTVGEDIQIIDNEVIGGFNGITFKAYSGLIKNNTIQDVSNIGLIIINPDIENTSVKDNYIERAGKYGIQVGDYSSGSETPNISIDNNDILDSGYYGLILIGATNAKVHNNRIKGSGAIANNTYSNIIVIYSDNVEIYNNIIRKSNTNTTIKTRGGIIVNITTNGRSNHNIWIHDNDLTTAGQNFIIYDEGIGTKIQNNLGYP
jgi:hypothetical protein